MTDEEFNVWLAASVAEAIRKITPESARAFLSQLSDYDENGQLKD